jgi:triosephosphate isomerase
MHAHIRMTIAGLFGADVAKGVRILYGGSVKPENAQELLQRSDIDGALVGGASLQADSFAAIVKAAKS